MHFILRVPLYSNIFDKQISFVNVNRIMYCIYLFVLLQCHQLFDSLQDLVDHINDFHVKPEKDCGYCCQWEGCARKGRGFNARWAYAEHTWYWNSDVDRDSDHNRHAGGDTDRKRVGNTDSRKVFSREESAHLKSFFWFILWHKITIIRRTLYFFLLINYRLLGWYGHGDTELRIDTCSLTQTYANSHIQLHC